MAEKGRSVRLFQKNGEEEEKRRGVSQESPQVFVQSLSVLKKRNIFLTKNSTIRNQSLTFALDKTQLSLHPAALRRPYSAKSRNCPDPPAQTLFDLLNHRDFALSLPYPNSLQRRCPSPSGDICTTATRPLGLVRKEGGTKGCFLPQERSTRLLLTTRFGQLHSFLVLPLCGESYHHDLIFGGLAFLKKKA